MQWGSVGFRTSEFPCLYSKNPHTRTPIFGVQADWVLIYRVFLGEISLKVFLSVLNFLLLKKCKGFTNYDEIHNFERKLNLRHTTLENTQQVKLLAFIQRS